MHSILDNWSRGNTVTRMLQRYIHNQMSPAAQARYDNIPNGCTPSDYIIQSGNQSDDSRLADLQEQERRNDNHLEWVYDTGRYGQVE